MKNLYLVILSAFLLVFSTSQAADLIQENEKGEFSAHLNNVKLVEITQFIQEKYGIEFKGEEKELQNSITLSFKNLDFEQMLKKILTKSNFVFTYNKLGKITKVTLLQTGKTNTNATNNQNIVNNNQSDPITNFPNTTDFPPDEITSFKIEYNVTPPGAAEGDSKSNEPDPITSFKIEPNTAPPGN